MNAFKLDITWEWNALEQVLTFKTQSMAAEIRREMVCFKDRVVREKLIELGWTPPPPQESPRDTRNDGAPWTDRSGGGGHTPEEIARAAGDVW